MNNVKTNARLIGTLVVGAVAGATLGILFAPRKGKKTREQIAGSAEKIAKNMKKKMLNEVKSLKQKAIKLEEKVEENMESISVTLQEKAKELMHMNSDHQGKQK